MAIVSGSTPDANSPQELAVGSRRLYHGARPWTFGVPADRIPVQEPLTPERIIVRSARRVINANAGAPDGMPAYAVYEQGTPTLPSVVFEVAGSDIHESLAGNRPVRHNFLVTVRAKKYRDVCVLTQGMMDSLRKDPSGRVREIGSSLDDAFAPQFEYRMRQFSVVIQL